MALAQTFNVGDKVSYKVGDLEYFGIVVTKHSYTASNIEYKISIFALGEVITVNSLTAEAGSVTKLV